MENLAYYRKRAVEALYERLQASPEPSGLDDMVDGLLRLSGGLPGRPAGRAVYLGLFPLPAGMLVSQLQFERMVGNPEVAKVYYPYLNGLLALHGIDNALRVSHFLAQALHESGHLRYMRELWGPTSIQQTYDPPGRKAQMLGNDTPGDGFRYRGGGWLQLTGKHNYREFSLATGIDLLNKPEDITLPFNAIKTACWYWQTRGINRHADKDDTEAVTRAINGGLTNLADRERILVSVRRIMVGA